LGASVSVKAFELGYAAKYPKAVAKITDDGDMLLVFYKYPAERWVHLRPNAIESTFATLRLRPKVTKGPGSRAAGIAMAYKLIDAAQSPLADSERATSGRPRPCRRGVPQGKLLERPIKITPAEPGESTETEVA
jgi:putative transposase